MGKTRKTIKTDDKQAASATKPASKHMAKDDADATISVPFEVGDLHIKALLTLFRCHHNKIELDYKELSTEMGIGEKTKRWQCEAWKDLKTHEFIVPAPTQGKLTLSDKGVAFAETFLSEEELADYMDPLTNEEHHEKIKSRLMRHKKARKLGPQIFDFLLQTKGNTPMTKHEIAAHFNTLADSHSFFYGFQGELICCWLHSSYSISH
jgi:hypothetical protein